MINSLILDHEIRKCSGAFPDLGFCIGSGLSREEFKDHLLKNGAALSTLSVFSLSDLCLKIVNHQKKSETKLINQFQSQFILETILCETKVRSHLPLVLELLEHKDIYRKIYDSFLTSRMSYSHIEERDVLLDKMRTDEHSSQLRDELVVLCQVFEDWIVSKGLVDLPLLLTQATNLLLNKDFDKAGLTLPKKVIVLSVEVQESRELSLWDALSGFIHVEKRSLEFQNNEHNFNEKILIKKAHTIEDAAEFFISDLITHIQKTGNYEQSMVLIPDQPQMRRVLYRVFAENNIPLVEDRDPTFVRLSEEFKQVFLPVELVLSGFSYEKVSQFLIFNKIDIIERKKILDIFYENGWSGGINNLKKDLLTPFESVLDRLITIEREWPEALSLPKFKEVLIGGYYFNCLSVQGKKVLDKVFETLAEAVDVAEVSEDIQPLSYWYNKIKNVLRLFPPVTSAYRSKDGISLYRLGQLCSSWLNSDQKDKKVFIFTLPSRFFSEPEYKSLFWTEWEREVLSSEFSLRSPRVIRDERVKTLKTWMHSASEVVIYDSHFDSDGAERLSLESELKFLDVDFESCKTIELGVSERWKKSFNFTQKYLDPNLVLTELKSEPQITASFLDEYSRCAYRALIRHKWKLEDLRAPVLDLYPDVQGQILHRCAEIIINDQVYESDKLEMLISQVFNDVKLKGTVAKDFLIQSLKKKMIPVLEKFIEQELDYQKRSGSKVFELESNELLEFVGKNGRIKGRADRIDTYKDGYFVIDYKTSSALPTGVQMIDAQYRLQLPFYAVALSQKTNSPVYGCQFIALTRGAGRGRGIFFKKFNGKTEGSLTHLRGNSHSLIDQDPVEQWNYFEEVLDDTLLKIHKSIYHARPKIEDDCNGCFAFDLCGKSRGFEKKQWNF